MELDNTSTPLNWAPTTEFAGPEVEQFANALDDCLTGRAPGYDARERLLALPRIFHKNATQRLAKLRPGRLRTGEDMDMDTDELDNESSHDTEAEIQRLEKEIQTWDLLQRVLPLRYSDAENESHVARLERVADKPSRATTLESFFESDPTARERRAVLQWLQTSAASGPDIDEMTRELQRNADRGDIIAHGWLHTRSAIKMKKSVTGWSQLLDQQPGNGTSNHLTSSSEPMVTQLDPDACTRQGRKLQPQDEYFERAIWLGCFEHLRRGSTAATIQEWCQERTEVWRSVSMSGLLLPAQDGNETATDLSASSLVLWRRMCYALATQGGTSDHERAVYGVLSGDIESVEKVARSWDDLLFAHYNALLRTQLDSFLLNQCAGGEAAHLTQTFPSLNAVSAHGEEAGVEKRLVRQLAARPSVADEAKEPTKALQASIVANELHQYLSEQGRHLASPSRGLDQPQYFQHAQTGGLRIIAHVYVLLSLLEGVTAISIEQRKTEDEIKAQETIVAWYAGYLRRQQLQELIPLYSCVLTIPRRYEVLSENLIEEEETERRITLLKLARKANIDTMEYVRTQANIFYQKVAESPTATKGAPAVFRILEESTPDSQSGQFIKADFLGDDEEQLADSLDEYLVRSLEWLLLVDEAWPDVFSMGVKAFVFFLRNMHLDAARRLMKSISFSAILAERFGVEDESMANSIDFWAEQLEGLPGNVQASPLQVMTDAQNFRDLGHLVQALDSLETTGAFATIAGDADVNTKAAQWRPELINAVKITKESMQPLLHNWMLASIQDGNEALAEIRQMYLPETILAYVKSLHFAGTRLTRDYLLECMDLATIITERDADLEATFVEAKRVRELLEAFAVSSKALAMAPGERTGAPTKSGAKKLREKGWTRDIWAALLDGVSNGQLHNSRIISLITNRKSAHATVRADKAGIPWEYFNLISHGFLGKGEKDEQKVAEGRRNYDAALAERILSAEKERPELIVLAGWMHVFSPAFLEPIERAGVRIINLHPALPGEFDGANAIERAFEELKAGRLTRTGIMAHYVIDEVDRGAPILVQEIEWKGEGLDELKERIHAHEHELIVKATAKVAQEIVDGRGS
ncbi:nuclear pore complex protein Nup107 [Emericellopsis cladophorae]|uniref:Nuclear pore complex protein n=1 Tax=Emericellopsis cladophorae TaxID=2686198 RepID=A0A9P9XWB4_9HYPO|nr:nuclear pore complex protein Nup107 [Emericellopsis cladophorae]KAI6779053.1 nuclear pore complex protein Nup107 [Emericellopsis cladophorae]